MQTDAPAGELRFDERDLAAQFGVSRTPLREALAKLAQEGLVKVVPRRGIYLVRKTKAEILDMIAVWAVLESMAARQACIRASDAEISSLHTLIETFSKDAVEIRLDEYWEANNRFHSAILELARCPLISEITGGFSIHLSAIRRRTIRETGQAIRSITEHTAIVTALERRDADRAERLVRDHTLSLREHVAQFIDLN